MGSSHLTQQILLPYPCVPSFSQTLAEKVVIGTATLASNSTLQELTYTDDASILPFQIPLSIIHFVLRIIQNRAKILYKFGDLYQMLRITKQQGSNVTRGQHDNNSEISDTIKMAKTKKVT